MAVSSWEALSKASAPEGGFQDPGMLGDCGGDSATFSGPHIWGLAALAASAGHLPGPDAPAI